jgi:hypothetical protein
MNVDYLVIGAGGMGMAFADTIVAETDATLAIVDMHDRPGGHWNDAYPFVKLHQPSSFYGVNSRRLGDDTKDSRGWNKGLYELASAFEVCSYFEQVMQRQLLPSGRVHYFPMCAYDGDGTIRSLVSGAETKVARIRKATVDATYMKVNVPSIRGPGFAVDAAATCVPPNELPRISGAFENYVVIGGGKTGVDSCLWLLRNDVAPDRIAWVMPRDSWLIDRANVQFGGEFYERGIRGRAHFFDVAAEAKTLEDLFQGLEECGQLLRLDKTVWPTMYRCSTVTQAELEQLRRLENIIRLGRVTHLGEDVIALEHGDVPTSRATLHIDCTADGLPQRPPQPIFAGNTITLQTVRACQQTFSAAFIAHVEASVGDDEAKNSLCQVVPNPDSHLDWLRATMGMMTNQRRWAADSEISDWLSRCRLDFIARATADRPATAGSADEMLRKAAGKGAAVMTNLKALLDEAAS